MRKILHAIDHTNEWMGLQVRWFMVAGIGVGVIEVIQRYVFNHPTMWGPEIMIMAGAAMYALSWGFVHVHQGHVRVDVLYSHFPTRVKAIIDTLCFVIFFLPVIGLLTYTSGAWMWRAWEINEKSVETYWYPPIAPLRTAVFIGIVLLLLQGLAQFYRDVYLLIRSKPYD